MWREDLACSLRSPSGPLPVPFRFPSGPLRSHPAPPPKNPHKTTKNSPSQLGIKNLSLITERYGEFMNEGFNFSFSESRPSVIQQCMRSVVLIKVGAVWGSGVIVNADKGIIITCRHVVHKAENRLGKNCLLHERVKFPNVQYLCLKLVYKWL